MNDRVRGLASVRTVRLGDVVERINERNQRGNANVLTISAMRGLVAQEGYFSRRVASQDLRPYYLLGRGDFAYNKSYSDGYPVGAIRRLDTVDSGVVSPLYICFRPIAHLLDSQFAMHYFSCGMIDDYLQWIAKEGARNHGLLNVGLGDFYSAPLILPGLEEQSRIAEILDSLDAQINAAESIVAKIRAVKVGIYGESFSRASSALHPIGEVAQVRNGTTPSRARRDFWDGGTAAWLASGKVNDYRITSCSERVTERAITECNLRILPAGSVVVGMIGQGRTRGMAARLEIPAAINQNLAGIVPGPTLLGNYLHHYLVHRYQELRGGGRGSNQDALNTRLVSDFLVPVPDREEQSRVAQALDLLDQRIDDEQVVVGKLVRLKLGMARELLTAGRRPSMEPAS